MLLIAGVDALLEPFPHFLLDPPNPVGAKLYPLGELAGRFQARDVLGGIQDQLLHLTLAQHCHHDTPRVEEHRDAPGVEALGWE